MAEALKDMFGKRFYEQLAMELNKVDGRVHAKNFVSDVTKNLDNLSLNERLRNTTVVMKQHLPNDYKKAVEVLKKVAPSFKSTYTALIFPDFVGQYGHDDVALSLECLKYFTQFGSSEFAIREFLKRDFKGTIKVMNTWAEDKNHHVRRLASEGCRGRLPWSFNLEEVMKNPSVTKSILEKLKADKELYVKKSVANHLNDFSKNHSDYLISVLKAWDNTNEHTAWIIKHASRTLIKKGDKNSLALFNFEKNVKIKVSELALNKTKIKLGEQLIFKFDVSSEKMTKQKLVIDFAVHYVKNSGELLPKVFKLKEIELAPKQSVSISKAHWFKDFTTRTHYPGIHSIEVLINGEKYQKKDFRLSI